MAIRRDDLNKQQADNYFERARHFVIRMNDAGPDMIQRRFRCSYSVAALIIERLENEGIISEDQKTRPRRVYDRPGQHT